jgi:hypothetical protein
MTTRKADPYAGDSGEVFHSKGLRGKFFVYARFADAFPFDNLCFFRNRNIFAVTGLEGKGPGSQVVCDKGNVIG